LLFSFFVFPACYKAFLPSEKKKKRARCMLSVAAQRGNAMMADACANHMLLPASFGDC